MNYTRNLKKGMKGDDVKYIQESLISLGHSCGKKGADGSFGSDTEKAVKSFQKDKKLTQDGIVGKKTWNAIEAAKSSTVRYTKVLKKGSKGKDVRYMKDCLFALSYYKKSITKISNDTFGDDTVEAVKKFQKANQLTVDGQIGKVTWNAIETDYKAGKKYQEKSQISLDKYTHISSTHRKAIENDLQNVSEIRQKIVLEILNYACDPVQKKEVRALYLFGANLYDSNLKINYADKAEIERLAKRNPSYFNKGRKEWMFEQVEKNSKLPASDCSGMEVGYLREHKLVKAAFDTTANALCGNSYSEKITKVNLKPGDWVGKSGHIGTYVGGGLVVEFYGGEYGCQLTELDNRKGWSFIDKKFKKGSAWTKYRDPIFY